MKIKIKLLVGSCILVAVFLGACGGRTYTTEEKIVAMMEHHFIAPMAYEDIEEPQSGYYHQPGAIEGGDLSYFEAGSSRVISESTPIQKVEYKYKIILSGSQNEELVPGFSPGFGMCVFGTWGDETWSCGLFRSKEDAKKYKQSYRKSPVPFIVCRNCKPKPIPLYSRLCPGVYSSLLGEEWVDPAMPAEIFNDKGYCTFNKPWWTTEEGMRLGVEKWGDKLQDL